MSGGRNNNRGSGRFGRGGRTRGRGNNSSSHKSSNNKSTARKTLADHVYSIGSAKQASDYSVINQFIINHIRKSFEFGDDIGDALENRKDIELEAPKLKPVSKDSENKELEERENEYLFKAEIAAFVCKRLSFISPILFFTGYKRCNFGLEEILVFSLFFYHVHPLGAGILALSASETRNS